MTPGNARLSRLASNYYQQTDLIIAQLKEAGKDIIRLDIGSPDLPPAAAVIETMASSATDPTHHGYQNFRGPLAYRQAWARFYQRTFNVQADPETQILPLMGSKEGIFNLTQALIEPGDVVLVPDPGYPTYVQSALFAGAEVVSFSLDATRGYEPDEDSIPADVRARARMLWLNYPNNPTGATIELPVLARLLRFCRKNDILLCHDAPYTCVTFDDNQAPSLLQVPGAMDHAVEFNSLSKSHNMAGWRMGVVLGSVQILRTLQKLRAHYSSGQFFPGIDAAIVALDSDPAWMQARNQVYIERRDLVIDQLRRLHMEVLAPRAGFYLWCRIPDGWTSEDFCKTLLLEGGVSLTPGTVFGAAGEGYLRISLGSPKERLLEAIQRWQEWTAQQQSALC